MLIKYLEEIHKMAITKQIAINDKKKIDNNMPAPKPKLKETEYRKCLVRDCEVKRFESNGYEVVSRREKNGRILMRKPV